MSDRGNGDYWFPAKRYGWGWGLPIRWQGWVVMGVFLAITIPVGTMLAIQNVGWGVGFDFFMVAILVVVVWKKGEPPRWRWSGE